MKKDIIYDPAKNHEAIVIIKQEDGNYKGYAWKHGKVVEVRDIDPNTVITRIITQE